MRSVLSSLMIVVVAAPVAAQEVRVGGSVGLGIYPYPFTGEAEERGTPFATVGDILLMAETARWFGELCAGAAHELRDNRSVNSPPAVRPPPAGLSVERVETLRHHRGFMYSVEASVGVREGAPAGRPAASRRRAALEGAPNGRRRRRCGSV